MAVSGRFRGGSAHGCWNGSTVHVRATALRHRPRCPGGCLRDHRGGRPTLGAVRDAVPLAADRAGLTRAPGSRRTVTWWLSPALPSGRRPVTRAYLSAGLPGAEWWVAGPGSIWPRTPMSSSMRSSASVLNTTSGIGSYEDPQSKLVIHRVRPHRSQRNFAVVACVGYPHNARNCPEVLLAGRSANHARTQ